MNNTHHVTLGMDSQGQVYGIVVDGNGNLIPGRTACEVIRPVTESTLKYCREDEESVIDSWKMAVNMNLTQNGLSEYFKEALAENSDPEWYPGKDESFVDNLIASNGVGEPGKVLFQDAAMDAEERVGEVVATWECAGWFMPSSRFEVVYGPRELVEAYYAEIGL